MTRHQKKEMKKAQRIVSIVSAWIEGKKLQYKDGFDNRWEDVTPLAELESPWSIDWNFDDYQYRIKE